MTTRTGTVIAVLLALVVAAGMTVAWFAAGRAVSAVPPLRAAPPIPAVGVGSTEVLLSADALTHPAHEQVREALQRHYGAINAKDYAAWAATVVPERSAELAEEQWLTEYDTTQDGTIRIDRIDDIEGARVLVRVRFVSTQDLDDAPEDLQARRICWRSSLPMSGEPPLIEKTGAESTLKSAC